LKPPLKLKHTIDALAAVIFPAPCRICGATLLEAGTIPICAKCLDSLDPPEAWSRGPRCDLCGRPFISPMAAEAALPLCLLCRRGMYAFERARSYSAYTEEMHKAVMLLKYEGLIRLAHWMGERMLETFERERGEFRPDVVTPVPLHTVRQRERGYNQAEWLARPLARKLGVPLRRDVLIRKLPRPDKLLLSRSERWGLARSAFAAREGARVDKLRVLLIDDVFTTGATLDACSRALLKCGAASVFGLTAARAVPNWASTDSPKGNQSGPPSISLLRGSRP
jgi:competence protein ComFC